MTQESLSWIITNMSGQDRKQQSLKAAGLFNPSPESVRDVRFLDQPEFFDPKDLLQVRYEMLRANLVDSEGVVAICEKFGISRQTFYNLSEKFSRQGTAGLLPRRPGPKGPSKLTSAIVTFAQRELAHEENLSGAILASRIKARFRLRVHRRTVEKLLRELRSKKNA